MERFFAYSFLYTDTNTPFEVLDQICLYHTEGAMRGEFLFTREGKTFTAKSKVLLEEKKGGRRAYI